jgi:hypothetical protein
MILDKHPGSATLCSADPYLVVDAALWVGDGHVASGIAPCRRYDDGDLLQVDLLAQRLVQDPRGVSQHLLQKEINNWLKSATSTRCFGAFLQESGSNYT